MRVRVEEAHLARGGVRMRVRVEETHLARGGVRASGLG